MTSTDDLLPGPTGLDYLAAYEALYPGLHEQGIQVSKLPDAQLKLVDRAARMRRRERERVKNEALALINRLDDVEIALSGRDYVLAEMIKLSEEIR